MRVIPVFCAIAGLIVSTTLMKSPQAQAAEIQKPDQEALCESLGQSLPEPLIPEAVVEFAPDAGGAALMGVGARVVHKNTKQTQAIFRADPADALSYAVAYPEALTSDRAKAELSAAGTELKAVREQVAATRGLNKLRAQIHEKQVERRFKQRLKTWEAAYLAETKKLKPFQGPKANPALKVASSLTSAKRRIAAGGALGLIGALPLAYRLNACLEGMTFDRISETLGLKDPTTSEATIKELAPLAAGGEAPAPQGSAATSGSAAR